MKSKENFDEKLQMTTVDHICTKNQPFLDYGPWSIIYKRLSYVLNDLNSRDFVLDVIWKLEKQLDVEYKYAERRRRKNLPGKDNM
jgi:hypothetical protein